MNRAPTGCAWRCSSRDDRAIQYSKIPLSIGEAFSGVLLNYLRYVIPDDTDSNKWRWPMTDYWLDMLEVLTPIKIYTAPGMDYNIDRCREYVVNQAGNAIDALLQIYGIHEFQRLIKERPTVENPKYTRLVQQYKADRLSALAGTVHDMNEFQIFYAVWRCLRHTMVQVQEEGHAILGQAQVVRDRRCRLRSGTVSVPAGTDLHRRITWQRTTSAPSGSRTR